MMQALNHRFHSGNPNICAGLPDRSQRNRQQGRISHVINPGHPDALWNRNAKFAQCPHDVRGGKVVCADDAVRVDFIDESLDI